MIRSENANFVASKYAPNPKEVSYWIDLTSDSSGNVIRSYRDGEWVFLNKDVNVDQWEHIQEIVASVGLNYNQSTDTISLPSMNSNNYFKGSSIVGAINNGDAAVKSQVDRLDDRIDTTNTTVAGIRSDLNTVSGKVNTLEDQVQEIIEGGGGSGEEIAAVNTKVDNFIATKGQNNGLATLNNVGKVPESQLPSYVDDVLEFENTSSFPSTGESGKIYVATSTNLTYRWSGSTYVEISPSIALGETASTAYPGNSGKATTDNLAAHTANTSNPHNVTKAQVGLSNVNNTSDLDKPISTATQTALNTLTSSINTKLSGTGVTDIQVVDALPATPNATTLYIVIDSASAS